MLKLHQCNILLTHKHTSVELKPLNLVLILSPTVCLCARREAGVGNNAAGSDSLNMAALNTNPCDGHLDHFAPICTRVCQAAAQVMMWCIYSLLHTQAANPPNGKLSQRHQKPAFLLCARTVHKVASSVLIAPTVTPGNKNVQAFFNCALYCN